MIRGRLLIVDAEGEALREAAVWGATPRAVARKARAWYALRGYARDDLTRERTAEGERWTAPAAAAGR